MKQKPILTALIFFLFSFSFKLFSQEQLPLYNAYFLAKAIANNSYTTEKKTDTLRQLLGGAIFYSNSDLYFQQDVDSLLQLTKRRYPVLNKRLETIRDSLFTKVSILALTEQQLIEVFGPVKQNRILGTKHKLDTAKNRLDSMAASKKIFDALYQEINKRDALRLDLLTKRTTTNADSIDQIIAALKIDSLSEVLNKLPFDSTNFHTAENEYSSALRSLMSIELTTDQLARLTKKFPQYTATSLAQEKEKMITSFSSVQVDASVNSDYLGTPMSFRMPSQSEAIDAMAIYLANRVKQESVLWFFQTLQKNIEAYGLTRDCFPACFALLQSNEIYEVPKMGASWRYAISKDFSMMPIRLLKSTWMQKKLATQPEVTSALETAWSIAEMVGQKYSYYDVVATLYSKVPAMKEDEESKRVGLNSLISILYVINEEMYQQKKERVQRLQLNDLLRMTDEEFEIMLSLIDLKYNHLISNTFFNNTSNFEIRDPRTLNNIKKWLGTILIKVQHIDDIRNDVKEMIKAKSKDDLQFQYNDHDTWALLKDLLSSLDYNSLYQTNPTFFKPLRKDVQQVLELLSDVQEVFSLLEQKNFAGCVNKLFEVTSTVMSNEPFKISVADFSSMIDREKISYYKQAVVEINKPGVQNKFGFTYDEQKKEVTIYPGKPLSYFFDSRDKQAINVIKNLSGFLSDVAYSQNSKDLSRVIEAYSMPPGSYKRKRATWLSFDVNAYVGAYAGQEWTKVTTAAGKDSIARGGVYGLTAPIGFTFSKTIGKRIPEADFQKKLDSHYKNYPERIRMGRKSMWKQSATTVSMFVSIIDIGAVVSYRFSSNEGSLPQQVKWSQILSPGVHVNVGIKNTPLVLAAGFQHTPKLRALKGVQGNEQLNANRFFGGVLFDLPLFNLYSKTMSRARYR